MIELTSIDEYGCVDTIDTFLTINDAKFALNQMLDAVEDTQSSRERYRLGEAINQLRQLIDETENNEDDDID